MYSATAADPYVRPSHPRRTLAPRPIHRAFRRVRPPRETAPRRPYALASVLAPFHRGRAYLARGQVKRLAAGEVVAACDVTTRARASPQLHAGCSAWRRVIRFAYGCSDGESGHGAIGRNPLLAVPPARGRAWSRCPGSRRPQLRSRLPRTPPAPRSRRAMTRAGPRARLAPLHYRQPALQRAEVVPDLGAQTVHLGAQLRVQIGVARDDHRP